MPKPTSGAALRSPAKASAKPSPKSENVISHWKSGADTCARGLCSLLKAGVTAAIFSGGMLGGLSAFASLAPEHEKPEKVAAVAPKPEPVLKIDLDGDGEFDIANPTEGQIRDLDAYGSGQFGASRDGGARAHAGVDYVAKPGDPVVAPIGGAVTALGYAYNGDGNLRFVEITNPETKIAARVFYVSPAVVVGDTVVAGDEIGAAQDLTVKYPGGMTNHVHVELLDPGGIHIDASQILPEGGSPHPGEEPPRFAMLRGF